VGPRIIRGPTPLHSRKWRENRQSAQAETVKIITIFPSRLLHIFFLRSIVSPKKISMEKSCARRLSVVMLTVGALFLIFLSKFDKNCYFSAFFCSILDKGMQKVNNRCVLRTAAAATGGRQKKGSARQLFFGKTERRVSTNERDKKAAIPGTVSGGADRNDAAPERGGERGGGRQVHAGLESAGRRQSYICLGR